MAEVLAFDPHRARTYLHKLRGRAHRFAWSYYRWRIGKGRKPGAGAARDLAAETAQMIRDAVDVGLGRKGPTVAPAKFAGWQERPGGKPPIPLYELTAGIPGHPERSHVSGATLVKAGFDLPDTPAPNPRGRRRRNPETVIVNGIVYEVIAEEKDGLLMIRRPKGRKEYVARRLADSPVYGAGRAYIVHATPARRNPKSPSNPPRRARAGGGARLIYPEGRIVGTWYGRHWNGKLYKHRFGRGLKSVYGLPGGDLILSAHKGRLWKTFF